MHTRFSSAPKQIGHRDFDKKTILTLSKKGVEIVGTQAVAAFDGDRYFSERAYKIVIGGDTGAIRTHAQLRVMASSSWNCEEFFKNEEN